jgi:hypothetical protein
MGFFSKITLKDGFIIALEALGAPFGLWAFLSWSLWPIALYLVIAALVFGTFKFIEAKNT